MSTAAMAGLNYSPATTGRVLPGSFEDNPYNRKRAVVVDHVNAAPRIEFLRIGPGSTIDINYIDKCDGTHVVTRRNNRIHTFFGL